MTGFAIQGSVRPKHISCQQSHCHATIFRQVQRQGNISSQIRGGARTSSGTQAQISTCLNTALRGRECRRHCRLDSKRDLNRESERCRTVVRAEPEGLEDHNLYAEQELRPVGPHSDNRVAEVIHALQHRSGDSIDGSFSSLSESEDEETLPQPQASTQFIAHRWRVTIMMALSFVLCNMDKVNMSVAVIPMAKELGWSASDRGLVSSAFFWGYSLTQIPAGYVSTRVGGASVLLAGVTFWSLGTMVAPPAAFTGVFWLCVSRVLVGLGEGLAPSSATQTLSRLIPETERARAVTMVFGSLDVGSVVGLLASGPLIARFGWPSVFYLFAVLGLLWACAWPLCKPGQSDPECPMVPLNSPQPETNNTDAKPQKQAVPWGSFLKSAPVWAIIVAHFCFNWGYYTLLAWLPSYFELALGLNVASSSLLTLIPYVAMVIMTPLVGPVADGLVKKGWTLTSVRKLAQGISFAGPALCLAGCAILTPAGANHTAGILSKQAVGLMVGLLSMSFALSAWARGGLYCNHQDLSPKYAAALLGITNTAGAIPGVLGISSVGVLLDKTNSWAISLFLPIIACQLFGLIIYSIFASSERQHQWT